MISFSGESPHRNPNGGSRTAWAITCPATSNKTEAQHAHLPNPYMGGISDFSARFARRDHRAGAL